MSFSAILGVASLASSFFGAKDAKKQASRDSKIYYQLQSRQLDQAQQLMDAQAADREYIRMREELDRQIAESERGYQVSTVNDYLSSLQGERQYIIDRQLASDKQAAQQRSFQLQQLIKNQQISAAERQFAQAELAKAQQIAAGERDEELSRLYEDRLTAQQEREFMLGQFSELKDIAASERQTDLDLREQIMSQITGLTEALQRTQSDLGYVPQIEQITPEMIDAERRRRESQYVGDVDRAATRVASVNEADLIRSGMDASSPAVARRGEITARIADEYRTARQRAYDDALAYISGKSETMNNNVSAIMNRRGSLLDETAGVYGAGIDQMINLPQLQSQIPAYDFATRIGTGIYDKNVRSANDYRAPVDVNTAIYDRIMPDLGIYDFLQPSTAASTAGLNVSSRIIAPYATNFTNFNGVDLNTAGRNMLYSAENARDASSLFGSNLMGTLSDYAPTIDKWFSGTFGRSDPNQSAESYAKTFYDF